MFATNFVSTNEGRVNHSQLSITATTHSSNNGGTTVRNGIHTPPALISSYHPPPSSTIRNELCGGARVSYILNDISTASLISIAFDSLSDEEISLFMSKVSLIFSYGTRSPISSSQDSSESSWSSRISNASWYSANRRNSCAFRIFGTVLYRWLVSC